MKIVTCREAFNKLQEVFFIYFLAKSFKLGPCKNKYEFQQNRKYKMRIKIDISDKKNLNK